MALVLFACAGCGSSDHAASTARVTESDSQARPISPRPPARTALSVPRAIRSRPPRLVAILPAARRAGLFGWTAAVAVRGQTAVWIARIKAYHETGFTSTLLRFDQRLLSLALHAGGSQPGGAGWQYGDAVGSGERRVVVAAINGGFQESYGAGGFQEQGRVGWPLRRGRASVVIYRDGIADIGRWLETVPAAGRVVEAVRQNLGLLVDAGRIPASVDTCVKLCWGDPLHEQPIVARSGLGVTPAGDLVWAAGHDLSARALAEALVGAGVARAMELDINPRWVAGYVYAHPRHQLAPIPLVPGQTGIPGQFLAPYFRDFLTFIAHGSR